MSIPNQNNPSNSESGFHKSVLENTFIVIAAFNEENAVGEVIKGLKCQYPNVVVVDDGSVDNTYHVAQQEGAIVLRHAINRGQGAALQTGISYSLRKGAKYIITFDADGQHSAGSIPQLLQPILRGEAQIVLGSRFLENPELVPVARRILLKMAIFFMRLTSGARLTDAHNGMRAFSREAASKIDIQLDRMAHASEIVDQIVRSRLPYTEVPVHVSYTNYSMSKGQKASAAFRVALDYLIGRVLK